MLLRDVPDPKWDSSFLTDFFLLMSGSRSQNKSLCSHRLFLSYAIVVCITRKIKWHDNLFNDPQRGAHWPSGGEGLVSNHRLLPLCGFDFSQVTMLSVLS